MLYDIFSIVVVVFFRTYRNMYQFACPEQKTSDYSGFTGLSRIVGFAQCHPSGACSVEVVLICGKFLDPWPNATRNLIFAGCRAFVEYFWFHSLCLVGDRGSTVVKVLLYKSEGRWFDPSWCHWNFSLT